MNEELDALTDKLLEVSMKLKASESKLKEVQIQNEKELSKFSHNLKNPVGVISSFAEMLKVSASSDEQKQAKYLEIIQSSSAFALDLVNSFQEYNKLKNGSVDFEMQSVNIVEAIQEVVEEVSTELSLRNQTIQIEVSCDNSVHSILDASLFGQAIKNILDNASRYSDNHSNIKILISEDENSIAITISDSGIGIPKQDLSQITNAFYTVNTYDFYKEKCIGLGLTKVHIILNYFGGTLSFSSETDRGTQAKIVLKKV